MTRRFGATIALSNVTVSFSPGEVHVLAGGNGAGKSTLIKILSGADSDYRGELWLEGAKVHFRSPSQARAQGIACIYQELSLVPNLSLIENIGLRRSCTSGLCAGLLGGAARARAREEAERLRRLMGLEVDPNREVRAFTLAERQLIEIGAALLDEVGVLVLDEPSSALSEREAECLFDHVQRAKTAGTSVIYISHRLEEVYRLADRISVLRDGELVVTARAGDLPQPELVRAMVGAARQGPPPPGEEAAERPSCAPLQRSPNPASAPNPALHQPPHPPSPVLCIDSLERASEPRLEQVQLQVGAGEIVGLCGLRGSSAKALLFALFGALPCRAKLRLGGEPYTPKHPRHALRVGVSLLPTDRKLSIFEQGSLLDNAILSSLPHLGHAGFLPRQVAKERVRELGRALHLRVSDLECPAGALSGGNQQKLALLRCLLSRPRLLLLEDPTRGIDVAAKADIYDCLRELAARGVAVVIESSELDELVLLCHRVHVFKRSRVVATVERAELSRSRLTECMMG